MTPDKSEMRSLRACGCASLDGRSASGLIGISSHDTHWSADDSDVATRQDCVEGARGLRVSVVDQEPHLLLSVVELQQPGCAPAAASTRYQARWCRRDTHPAAADRHSWGHRFEPFSVATRNETSSSERG
jgi:hypothetical protein